MKNKRFIVRRPWGGYSVIEKRRRYWIKKIFINKGARLSLQTHKNRSEVWIVLSGEVAAFIGNTRRVFKAGEILKINKREKHRMVGLKNACALEVAFGEPRERDIVRYEDDYGRVKSR